MLDLAFFNFVENLYSSSKGLGKTYNVFHPMGESASRAICEFKQCDWLIG